MKQLLVVGAGFSGAVMAERFARVLGWHVLVVDRRDHIGGNAFDQVDEHGILVHRYGPHVFHTNDSRIWAYASRFTDWRRYTHRVRALVGDQLLPLPINLRAIRMLFPGAHGRALITALLASYGAGASVPVLRLRQSPVAHLQSMGESIYEAVYGGYTRKQWGLSPTELDPSVTGRIPIRLSSDDRYFVDRYQGMPRRGYTAMVARMLRHPRIEVVLKQDFHDLPRLRGMPVVYTGPVDRYFDYSYGPLPYRSLGFRFTHSGASRIQPTGAITYPGSHAFTRSVEYRILTGQRRPGTTIGYEFPQSHQPGETEPYYPIPAPFARALHSRYAKLVAREQRVHFQGRLGRYQYLNMDQAIGSALAGFERLRARLT